MIFIQRREFHYTDAKSDKFWAIELDGASYTVQFGRVGTAGQAQTKGFASEDEAKKSCEKLIAEKIKKGYAEVGAAGSSAGQATAKPPSSPKPKPQAAKVSGEEKITVEQLAQEVPAPQVNTAIARSIELDPEDWLWATWRKWQPLPRPAPAEFDLKDCAARLARVTCDSYGRNWRWEKVNIPASLSPQEAHFWFAAMTGIVKKEKNKYGGWQWEKPKDLASQLAKETFKGRVSAQEIKTRMKQQAQILTPSLMLPLVHLLSFAEIVNLLRDIGAIDPGRNWGAWQLQTHLLAGFRKYVLPYATAKEVEELKKILRPELDPKKWPDIQERPPAEFHLAAFAGMHNAVRAVVSSWRDDFYTEQDWSDHYHLPQLIVFGLGDPGLVESEMRRLRLRLKIPDYVRAWLAHTECAALDYVRDSILATTNKEEQAKLIEVLCQVKAPEAAPVMLELQLSSKVPQLAGAWLAEQVGNAIAGLIPVAAGRGKLAEAAVAYLRDAKRKGHEDIIRGCVAQSSAEVAAKVRQEVLEHVEKVYAPFDASSTPRWLQTALKEAQSLKGMKPPDWVRSATLPPVVVDERRLSDEQVEAVLAALNKSNLTSPHTLLTALREHGDRDALDAFSWRLFELWLTAGTPSKDKWALAAVGFLGSDACALKLTPLVRAWPGESQHQRAVLGLECLRAIGTDTALMQLNGIAQKLKFKGLQNKAREFMAAIATERGLTPAQLEDRIVPDCDLDERGSRTFDFGSRTFRFVLGPQMKPIVRDDESKVKPDLPKPGSKDDAALAERAIQEWKLLKKQVGEVAKVQAVRLEQAMVTGRRWSIKDFETLLVRHPLMTNLVRLQLWGGYDDKGKLVATFRVTEEQDYADAQDESVQLKGMDTVGIVHPLHLSAELKSAWGEVFSDYEIIPPFPQLGRSIFTLQPGEEKSEEITRFKGIKMPAASLIYTLDKFAWMRALPADGGGFYEHSKPFYGADVTAIVQYEPGVSVGYVTEGDDQQIERCFFVQGIYTPTDWYPEHKKRLKLSQVDPVVISEVLSDLTTIAAKGK